MKKCVRFEEIQYPRDELGCTLQNVEMKKSQRSASLVEKHGVLREQQMAQTARVRGIPPQLCSTRGKKTHEILEPRLQCRYQFQTVCVAEDGTRGAEEV